MERTAGTLQRQSFIALMEAVQPGNARTVLNPIAPATHVLGIRIGAFTGIFEQRFAAPVR